MDVLKPTPALLCKLGSAIVHIDEALSRNGHAVDWTALQSIMKDEEVIEWLKGMDSMSLLPVKR